jgi:Cys-tRNA(Pro)/Cys-tRNA(Cys) deacylase
VSPEDASEIHPDVLVALEASGVRYTEIRHRTLAEPVTSPADVARLVGIELDQILKTILVAGAPDAHNAEGPMFALIAVPVASRLDFRAVAVELGWKRATMASAEQLNELLGQPRFGVSPLAAANLEVVVDERIVAFESVLVGGGAAGVEVRVASTDLITVTGARLAPVGMGDEAPRSAM